MDAFWAWRQAWAEASEHALALSRTWWTISRAFGPAYLAPLGEAARPILVGRHGILPAMSLARSRDSTRAAGGEVVTAIVDLHPVAVPRHAHIGAVPVHAGGGEQMRAIDGHALRLVEGAA
jgi:hypothetical protein